MLIEFGELKKRLLIPILFPFFLKLRKLNRKVNSIKSSAFRGFNDFLSLTICGILYLILKLNLKSEKDNLKNDNKNDSNNNSINTEQKTQNQAPLLPTNNIPQEIENLEQQKEKKQRRKQWLFVGGIAALQLSAIILKTFWKINMEDTLKLNISVLIEVILLIIFSYNFLGLKIHSHQVFSFIIIFICLTTFFLESLFYEEEGIVIKFLIEDIANYFLVQLVYCLSDVLGKKYLNTYLDSPYLLLFKMGIVGIVPIIIYGIIIEFLNVDNEDHKIFSCFKTIFFPFYLIDLIFTILYEIGIWLTIYYFSPCHYIVFEMISDFIEVLLTIFIKNDQNKGFDESYNIVQKITFYVLYPILIFIVLVFNEVIILNFWGLSYNTKAKIREREKSDIDTNIIDQDLMDSDNNYSEIDNQTIDGFIIKKNQEKN